ALEGDVWLPAVRSVAAYNRRNLEEMARLYHPDAVHVNHALGTWEELALPEYIAYCQSLFDLAEQSRLRAIEGVQDARGDVLSRVRLAGERDGGPFSQDWWLVTKMRDGFIERIEQFPIDRHADAEVCFRRYSSS
ncbi:MAG TPA: nuclear transport factor 2 family protein, partial [Acidimicrobiales bacterium]|nr:nuclear transport factor 2 family protein [Acidimicrobiales bacterium]